MNETRQHIAALALPAILLITACGSNNTVKNDEGATAPAARSRQRPHAFASLLK